MYCHLDLRHWWIEVVDTKRIVGNDETLGEDRTYVYGSDRKASSTIGPRYVTSLPSKIHPRSCSRHLSPTGRTLSIGLHLPEALSWSTLEPVQ